MSQSQEVWVIKIVNLKNVITDTLKTQISVAIWLQARCAPNALLPSVEVFPYSRWGAPTTHCCLVLRWFQHTAYVGIPRFCHMPPSETDVAMVNFARARIQYATDLIRSGGNLEAIATRHGLPWGPFYFVYEFSIKLLGLVISVNWPAF